MIRNYIITALRNIFKNKIFSFLNILGLALGMGTTVIILLWVQDELNYDKFNEDYKSIYRITESILENDVEKKFAVVPGIMAETLLDDYPEVISACRFRRVGNQLLEVNKKKYDENVVWADSSFFNFFNIALLEGNKDEALNKPRTAVISQSRAKKYFADKSAVGEKIMITGDTDYYTITGIYEDIPKNSHFHFDIIFTLESWDDPYMKSWGANNYVTYIKLRPDSDPDEFSAKTAKLVEKYIAPYVVLLRGGTIEEYMENNRISFSMQALTDIHLKSDLIAEFETNSNYKNVKLFSVVALIILIIACINFMNLSTARSVRRSMEVGMRKVSGAKKTQILRQHMIEAFVMTVIAYFIAMILVEISLPYFNNLTDKDISIDYLSFPTFIKLFIVLIITGVLAGSYPSFYISSFRPIKVLAGSFISGKGSGSFRNILVVIQFMATIILVSISIFLFQQLKFINKTNIGFDKENVICIHNEYLLHINDMSKVYIEEMLKYPQIISSGVSSYLPVHPSNRNRMPASPDGDRDRATAFQQWYIHTGYIETLKMKIIAGRDFSVEFPTDSSAIIINEALARQFDWEDPLEHYLILYASDSIRYRVIGVVEDFHYESLHTKVGPLLMRLGGIGGYCLFRYESDNTSEIVSLFQNKWKELLPDEPFDYSFIEDRFNNDYVDEHRTGTIMLIFTILAIIVASLGLLGLTIFIAEKRNKEIGIRKVNGASISSIFLLFSKNVSRLVLIAFILSVPPCWYFINKWLNNFEYRIDIDWKVFVFAGIISLFLALITIFYQTVKAARMNPADSLRYE
ncbi:ABC transporter permease [Bacteroidota bacterium]